MAGPASLHGMHAAAGEHEARAVGGPAALGREVALVVWFAGPGHPPGGTPMLTRLKVNGFKNLQDVDVRLGPFTCIAGPNGVGKSNFFDAIGFLAALADKSLIDAALSVRGGQGHAGDVRSLFRRSGRRRSKRMSFLVEMIIPSAGEDMLGQEAEASMTYLTYQLELRYRSDPQRELRPRSDRLARRKGRIEIVSESLEHLNRSQARANLGFEHSKAWRDSAVRGRRSSPFISTTSDGLATFVSLHADTGGQTGARQRKVATFRLPRTMLSSVNAAAEHRTLVLARQEMMSWTQLQLEPTALRAPDPFTAPHTIGANGAHVPATLYHLAQLEAQRRRGADADLYSRIANRLAELNEDARSISVDVDEKRQLLNIVMRDRQGTPHMASSLSDGTLRFLALAVMEQDPGLRSLLCLEEPENGIHPRRVPAMLRLLQDLAVDPEEPVGADNPMRQVIVNTHSPQVVAEVPDDSLLVAESAVQWSAGERTTRLRFSPLPDTWRTRLDPTLEPVARGKLQDYLNPLGRDVDTATGDDGRVGARVKDREDLQMLLPFGNRTAER
jgi:predicted ATPase